MCFSVIAGKRATDSGFVFLAANDDWPGCPGHVHYVPARDWAESGRFLTVKGREIPQPAHTFGYTHSAAAYEIGTRKVSWPDGVNDQKVAVSIQGVYAFANYQKEGDLLEADDIVILMLERARTAREAITLTGELIAQYGYTVSTIDGAEGTVVVAIADPGEGWFLELGPGGYWCAQRVRGDAVECRPNCFGIGDIDFEDSENFICSPGLYELAVEKGLIRKGETLNFSAAFGGDYSTLNPGYGGAMNPVNMMRRWTVVNRLGSRQTKPEDPIYSCVPVKPLSISGLMTLMRDDLSNTSYSLERAAEAGPHHNPFWMTVSTSIAQSGTVICMIAELSDKLPNDLGCRIWFSYGNARISPFVPCYSGGRGLPQAYQIGECGDFDWNSAWWLFEDTAEVCYRNYEAIVPHVVIPAVEALEERFRSALSDAEAEALKDAENAPERARERLAFCTDRLAEEALEETRGMAARIRAKYLCNTVLDWL